MNREILGTSSLVASSSGVGRSFGQICSRCMTIMSQVPPISVELVKKILIDTLDTLESPELAPKLNEAKEAAGNEMLKMMQIVFPMVVHIEMEAMKRNGLTNNRMRIVQFTQLVREMELVDTEVAQLHAQIRTHFLPPVSISSTVDTSL